MFLSVWFISLSIYVLKAYLGCPMYQNFIPFYSRMILHYIYIIYTPPWTWGISSQLLQQSTAAAPYDYTVELRNRFKGLDLIDREPDELWMEVRDIVQETGIKTIPWKRNAERQNGCLRRPYK